MLLKKGDSGTYVTYLQYGLRIMCFSPGSIDGSFGDGTFTAVKKFQSSYGLTADGIVGDNTWNKLSSEIKSIQNALNNKGYSVGTADGIAGASTYNAVLRFQSANGLTADGMVGSATRSKLFGSGIKDITSVLNGLMLRYEYIYISSWSNLSVVSQLGVFYDLVKNKGELDLKNQGFNDSKYIFNGNVVPGDAPGNILYGYLGKAFKYGDELLLRAAGYAQIKAGNSEPQWGTWSGSAPYGDDPSDQKYIKVGINYYKQNH